MNEFIYCFLIYIIGSHLGFLCETIWCILKNGKLESRKGLIYETLIPIYGIAALLITVIIEYFNIKNYGIIFIISFLISGIIEYVSSVIQERCFHTKSWDYSHMKFNLNGRINFVYLLLFSIIGVFWCKIYPVIINFIINIFKSSLKEIIIIIFIFNVYDTFISICASLRQRERREGIKPKNKYELWLDKKYNDEKMMKIYANAKVI